MVDVKIKSGRYSAGVLKYAQMGYWDGCYSPISADILAAFRITHQNRVSAIEAVYVISISFINTTAILAKIWRTYVQY